MKLEMKDAPGQLVSALEPISDLGGNIIAVIHQRDPGSHTETLGVQIVLDLPVPLIPSLTSRLRDRGVNILVVNEERLICTQTVILIGHLIHTDLGGTVDAIDTTGYAEVTDLSIRMPGIDQRSSARIVIRALNRQSMDEALAILRKVAQEKDLFVIEPLEGLA